MTKVTDQAKRRPASLVLLALYKLGEAIVLFAGAIVIWFTGSHHTDLREYVLPSHRFIISWVLKHLAQIPPHTLQFAAIAACLYGTLSTVEAIGIWFEKHWGRWLILVGVGVSLPFELIELFHHLSWIKLILFAANLLAFWYVLQRFPQSN